MNGALLFFSLLFIFSCTSEISKDEKAVNDLCACYSKMDNEIHDESNYAWQNDFYPDAMQIIRLQHVETFLLPKIISGIEWVSVHGKDPAYADKQEKEFRVSLYLLRILSDEIRNLNEERKLLEVKAEDRDSSYYREMLDFAELLKKHYGHYRKMLEKKQDHKIGNLINSKGKKFYLQTYQRPENLTQKQFDYYSQVNEILYPYLEEIDDFDAKAFQAALKSKCGMRFW